jgi:uncharacterized protein
MAFDVKKIDPLDLQPRKAIGVSLPFSGQAVFNSTYKSKDAIKANLINYFLTNKGERYLNPYFGSNLRSLLFENIIQDTLGSIKDTIETDVRNYFPRVFPTLLEINSEPDSNSIRFYMAYQIVDTNIQDQLLISIEQ